jgi:hypothetical protein
MLVTGYIQTVEAPSTGRNSYSMKSSFFSEKTKKSCSMGNSHVRSIVAIIENIMGYDFYSSEIEQEWFAFLTEQNAFLQKIYLIVSRLEESCLSSTVRDNFLACNISSDPLNPEVSRELQLLHEYFVKHVEKVQMPLIQKWFWPRGREFAVVLTHDIDTMKFSLINMVERVALCLVRDMRVRNFISSLVDIALLRNPIDPRKVVSVEKDFGIRSTFFIVVRDSGPERQRKIDFDQSKTILKNLHDNDFEIGLHGSYDTYLDSKKLASEKRTLEKLTGNEVEGIRQHWLHCRVPETIACQGMAGLRYDSSIGFNDSPGFRAGLAHPFHPINLITGECCSILELPLTLMDVALLRDSRDVNKAWKTIEHLINVVKEVNGMLVVNWHNTSFDETIYPERGELYRMLLRKSVAEGAWVARSSDVAHWWSTRSEYHLSPVVDGSRLILEPNAASEEIHLRIYLPKSWKLSKPATESTNPVCVSGNAKRIVIEPT